MISKFRAWDIKTKTMRDAQIINFETGNIVVDMGYADIYEATRWNALLRKDKYVLMQYTGLKDVNGNEIYEGDIVKAISFSKWIGVVKFSEEKSAFMFEDSDTSTYGDREVFLNQFNDGFEIIGNIYENAELLEVTE